MIGCTKTLYEEYITGFLKEQIAMGRKRFVLYPNGEIAKMVKRILISQYNIIPEYTVDNYTFNGENILNLEQKRHNKEAYIF